MTHSPLPWSIDASDAATIVDGNKHFVADADMQYDAAFIVRAVNAHDDLVAALKAAKGLVIAMGATNITQMIDAALAKAGA